MVVRGWLLVLALAPVPAFAQQAEAPPPKPLPPASKDKDGDLEAVVVTAPSQQDVRMEIDRRSYSVVKEVQAQTGLADTVRTPTLNYRRSFRGVPPSIVFGLTYNFRGGPKAPPAPAFAFGAGPS